MELDLIQKQMLYFKNEFKINNTNNKIPISSSAFAIESYSTKHKMRFNDNEIDEGVVDEDEDDEKNDVFIERMDTIIKNPFSSNISKLRRQSVHQLSASLNTQKSNLNSSNYWSYDELNELKMKFISLLSTNNNNNNRDETKRFSSIHYSRNSPLTTEEHNKIESFYRSFGTQLYVTKSHASLYTLSLEKINENGGINNVFNVLLSNDVKQFDWCVQHYGVPLWLFNTGLNSRRPYRQLKFTLAEKGTGFILWQDRIDFRSEFKVLSKKKYDTLNYSISDQNEFNDSKSFIITFKASDRNSLVFVKFDINSEISKFFEFYFKINRKLIEEIKLRTKSLPINVGCQINPKKLPKEAKNKLEKMKNIPTSANLCLVKYKRISKNDISKPSHVKHIINVRLNDRFTFYTLSKLLPYNDSLIDSSSQSSTTSSLKSNLSSATSTYFSSS